MKEVLETTQLEFDKSAFLIDLIKHYSGSLYIEIIQTIYADQKDGQSIKINPSILTDIKKSFKTIMRKSQDKQPMFQSI